jgi:hypothetical protein
MCNGCVVSLITTRLQICMVAVNVLNVQIADSGWS